MNLLTSSPRPAKARRSRWASLIVLLLLGLELTAGSGRAGELSAGVAKVDITDREAGPVHDPLYVKALVLSDGTTTVALVTVDAVALAEIGRVKNDYLKNVRAALERELHLEPSHLIANASHCHGVICKDVEPRTVQAVKEAWHNRVPVKVGAGVGREDRIQENRRVTLKNGAQADMRRAYAMPRDEDVAAIGPVDPQIGLLRLDRKNGEPLAVVYNFACHPIDGVPSGGNTADLAGIACQVIEENLGATALFVQGCAGDINPIAYKDVHAPHHAEALGNLLGLSALRALRKIETRETAELEITAEVLALPRGADLEQRIAKIQTQQQELLGSLKGNNLNFKTFLPLYVQYQVSGDFPASYAHRYLHEQSLGRDDLEKFDAENRAQMEQYLQNIQTMEQLTRLQANLDLLKMHQAQNAAAGSKTLDAEVVGLRVGDFRLVTFPGELSVEIGLGIKQRAPAPLTFVAGYTNGYIYYTPTEQQRANTGFAQEDCDCLVAPEWRKLFDEKVDAILKRL